MGIIAKIYRDSQPSFQPYTDYQASGIAFKIAMTLFLFWLAVSILAALFGIMDASSVISSVVTVGIYQFINYKVSKKILMN